MLGVPTHFAGVAASELVPTRWIVPEPLSQRGARCDIFEPFLDGRRLLRDAAGPKAVDQYPGAVAASGRFVCPLQPDICGRDALAHLGSSGRSTASGLVASMRCITCTLWSILPRATPTAERLFARRQASRSPCD